MSESSANLGVSQLHLPTLDDKLAHSDVSHIKRASTDESIISLDTSAGPSQRLLTSLDFENYEQEEEREEERRFDLQIDDQPVTYSQMCDRLGDQRLSQAQLDNHWANLDLADGQVERPVERVPCTPPSPCGSRHVRPVFGDRKDSAQKLFNARLAGLKPSDFHPDGIAIYTTSALTVPPELQHVSKVITSTCQYAQGVLPREDMELLGRVPAVVIFCNIFNPNEMQLAVVLSTCIAELGDLAPPTILVPNVLRESASPDKSQEFDMLAKAVSCGIDCTISGYYQGFKLAFMVRAEMTNYASKVNIFNKALDAHRERVQYAQELDNDREEAVWGYGRVRLKTGIPRVEDGLGEARPGLVLGDFQVSRQVGQGASGKVYALEARGVPAVTDAPTSDSFRFDPEPKRDAQVLKVILKEHKADVRGILELRNEIAVMKSLSTVNCSHPNIVRLHEVYHSRTHIMFRMDDGGPRNLYKCLRGHEINRFPLGPHKAKIIILQCVEALCHLHLVANVQHRDIKPENIIIRETAQDINAKIADFDLAGIMQRGQARTSVCGGTFPFMAPEMIHGTPYEPFAADIWSMAIVFLEILCCCDILAKALSFPRLARDDPQRRNKQMTMTKEIQNYFTTPGSVSLLLSKFSGPELAELVGSDMTELLSNEDGMLAAEPSQRITTEEIREGMGLDHDA